MARASSKNLFYAPAARDTIRPENTEPAAYTAKHHTVPGHHHSPVPQDLGTFKETAMHPLIASDRQPILAIAPQYGMADVRIFGSMADGDADTISAS